MTTTSADSPKTPFRDILGYTTGDGANSLVLNSIFGFAMLYYTEALGLDPILAGWAMAVATFWDAITDPVMGHITDNTRSRFGRRHPYMLVGGVITAVCYFFVWGVPEAFQGSAQSLFWYLVVVNLLLRTGITTFAIPHAALGFEICTDYTQRATVQGVRWGFNMFVNLAGPAMAWTLFFPDKGGVESTTIADNYVRMGGVFSVAALGFVLFVVFATRKYIIDTSNSREIGGSRPSDFAKDFKEIISDKYPRTVFIFIAVVLIGMVLVSALQMYVYVHFMKFSAGHKSIVHGSTMVACGLGGLLSSLLVKKFDKKPAVCMAVVISVVANAMLLVIFLTGWLPPGAEYTFSEESSLFGGMTIPIAMLVFLVFHAMYWAGGGIMLPIANSMMADISEICKHRTGVLKDGGYSAMLSFITKTSMSIGLLLSGYCLEWAGIKSKTDDRVIAVVMEETLPPTTGPVTTTPTDLGVELALGAVRVEVAPMETRVSASYTVTTEASTLPFTIRLGLDTSEPPDGTIDTYLTDSDDPSKPRDIHGDVTPGMHQTAEMDVRGVLDAIGAEVKGNVQSPKAIHALAFVTFTSGLVIALLAMVSMLRYPVTREFMEKIKTDLAKASDAGA